jgi:hypothetical protein
MYCSRGSNGKGALADECKGGGTGGPARALAVEVGRQTDVNFVLGILSIYIYIVGVLFLV